MDDREHVFKYCMSPRCFRYREDAISSHAPQGPGIYEFVSFDQKQQSKVLYIGLALENIAADLLEHWRGAKKPAVQDLLTQHTNLYFDYVDWSEARDVHDLKDIAAALCSEHHPLYNLEPLLPTGRFEKVILKEVEVPLFRPT